MKQLWIILIVGVVTSSLAQSSEIKDELGTDGRGNGLSVDKTVEILAGGDNLDGVRLYAITSAGIHGREKETGALARRYATDLSRQVHQVLLKSKPMWAGKKNLSSADIERLFLIRSKLLDAGGYGNLALAALVTRAIHLGCWQSLFDGRPLHSDMFRNHGVRLAEILPLITKCADIEGKRPCFDLESLDRKQSPQKIVEDILNKHGVATEMGRGIPIDYWTLVEKGWTFGFYGRRAFEDSNSATHLVVWLSLLDEEYALDLVSTEVAKDPAFLQAPAAQVKERIGARLPKAHQGLVVKCTDLRMWQADDVYDYPRELAHSRSLPGMSAIESHTQEFLTRPFEKEKKVRVGSPLGPGVERADGPLGTEQ